MSPKNHRKNGPTSRNYFLYVTAATASLMVMSSGITFSWTSPVLPKLDAEIGRRTTPGEKSWIAGFLQIGGVFGAVIAGRLADEIGRKKTQLLVACPMMLSFLIAAFAKTVPFFYLARFLMGVASGSTFTILPLYLVEISENHNRGSISSFTAIFTGAGVLFSYIFGPFLSIRNFSLICLVPVVIFVVIFSKWMPETPQYLASKSNQNELRRSLSLLRNKNRKDIEDEAKRLISLPQRVNKSGTFKDLIKTKSTRAGLWFTIGLMIWQQSAGISAINGYMQTIFEESGSRFSSQTSPIIIGSIQLITSVFLTTLIIDRFDRRVLLIMSSSGACVSLLSLGLYFYLKSSAFNTDNISWLPLVSLMVYITSFSSGISMLPVTIAAELFPLTLKAKALTVSMLVRTVTSFAVATSFPFMVNNLGMAQACWNFSLVSFGFGIVLFWFLPETRGKSLQEIQDLLEGDKKKLD